MCVGVGDLDVAEEMVVGAEVDTPGDGVAGVDVESHSDDDADGVSEGPGIGEWVRGERVMVWSSSLKVTGGAV